MPVRLDSATQPQDANGHLRRHARTLFSVPLTLRHLSRSGVRATHGISLDIGEGGLGVLVEGDVHAGDTVAIDFRLWEQALTAVAIVRHTTNIRSGLEFVGLTSEERLQIANGIPLA
jgi:PilZ domain